MKKRFFSMLMVCAMVLGLVACGGNEPTNEPVDKVETESTIETEVEDKTLVASGITVDGEFGKATSVSCAEVTNGDVYDAVVAELANGSTGMAVWNIDIIDAAGTAIQPDGSVTITLTLPDSLLGADGDTYTVYRQEGDGAQTMLPSEVKGNTIVFATEHFSIYTVVKTDSQAVVEEDSEVAVEDTTENDEVVTEEEVVPEEPVAPKTEYTYTALDKTMYAKQSVNVRDLPSTDGERVGGLSARQEVHVTGQCNETGWYRIDYNGDEAFVSNSYIVAERPAEPEQPKPDEPAECPYELGVWYDMGWYFFKLMPSKENFVYDAPMEYYQTLNQRYPGYETFEAGCDTKWGNYVAVVATYPLQGDYIFN